MSGWITMNQWQYLRKWSNRTKYSRFTHHNIVCNVAFAVNVCAYPIFIHWTKHQGSSYQGRGGVGWAPWWWGGLRRGKGEKSQPPIKITCEYTWICERPHEYSMLNSPYKSWAPRNVLVPPRNEILAMPPESIV